MAIYRGPGGPGDATADSANQAQLALEYAQNAATSATNASNSATAAASSASAASTSESNASTSASAASSSASAASTSATNASNSATAAASSASAASTSESNAAASESAAAASESAAGTSETNAAASESAAATSETNAAASEAAAATSETNAAASESAAATSESNASTSETNAAASASAASTSASNAATSATNASNSASAAATSESNAATSESNAATSESNAATSASNAASSASAASTSASNASTSETNAAASASAAATSAANAAASYDSFDDRYLGTKASDPTLDNDGNALVTGALYYNTTDGEMRVYDGSQWLAASAASQAILVVYSYTATAAQTTFTGADDNAVTLSYTQGSIIVTLNGVVLEDGTDYTATNGTSVVLTTGAALNDEVNIHAFTTFDVANVYTQAQSDARYLQLSGGTLTGTLNATALNTSGQVVFNDAGADVDFRVEGDTDANLLFVDASTDRVGIGTSTPAGKLHVFGDLANTNAADATGVAIFRGGASAYSGYIGFDASTMSFGTSNASRGLSFVAGGSERMRLTSAGEVLVNTTTEIGATPGYLTIQKSSGPVIALFRDDTGVVAANSLGTLAFYGNDTTSNTPTQLAFIQAAASGTHAAGDNPTDLVFGTTPDGSATVAEKMRLTSEGYLGVNVTAPTVQLDVQGAGTVDTDVEYARFRGGGSTQPCLRIGGNNTTDSATRYTFINSDSLTAATAQALAFQIDGAEKMRIDSSGNLLVGKTASALASAGAEFTPSGLFYFTRASNSLGGFNRTGNDGVIVNFYQDGTAEGNISVSGTTVSYNGGHLSRWAQTLSAKDESLKKGTVLSNLDEMNVYVKPTLYWTEEDELPVDEEGNPTVAVGDVKQETSVSDNEQLNKVKVSDVEGDPNVAGVFVNWSYDEAHEVDEINMAMTGDMIIRIAEGVTVARGDLLMSAGDGTAKPQGDDIVRSKTIAKVTSTHVTRTYDDGSYCVPCVLMAC